MMARRALGMARAELYECNDVHTIRSRSPATIAVGRLIIDSRGAWPVTNALSSNILRIGGKLLRAQRQQSSSPFGVMAQRRRRCKHRSDRSPKTDQAYGHRNDPRKYRTQDRRCRQCIIPADCARPGVGNRGQKDKTLSKVRMIQGKIAGQRTGPRETDKNGPLDAKLGE